MTQPPTERPLDVFIVAGEDSGDKLGGPLMAALKQQLGGHARFRGVGGDAMEAQGLKTQFPMEDVTAIGFVAVLKKLPLILRRLRETAAAVAIAPPDVLLLIDSPDFTGRVAKRVRRVLPDLPIVKYVSPTVWIWRPGRARAMRPYIDHILALFPFEPEVHRQLGGPPCTYVGHPLLEHLLEMRPASEDERRARADAENPLVLVLPGSRRSEISRLSQVFGETVARIRAQKTGAEFVLPTLPSRLEQIRQAVSEWPVQPRLITNEAEKYAAFRRARAAIAASGTITLELALAQIPMVVAYKLPTIEEKFVRAISTIDSPVLPNILLKETFIPDFLQSRCKAANLAPALLALLDEGEARERQLEGFTRIDAMFGMSGENPKELAARTIIQLVETKTGRSAPRS